MQGQHHQADRGAGRAAGEKDKADGTGGHESVLELEPHLVSSLIDQYIPRDYRIMDEQDSAKFS